MLLCAPAEDLCQLAPITPSPHNTTHNKHRAESSSVFLLVLESCVCVCASLQARAPHEQRRPAHRQQKTNTLSAIATTSAAVAAAGTSTLPLLFACSLAVTLIVTPAVTAYLNSKGHAQGRWAASHHQFAGSCKQYICINNCGVMAVTAAGWPHGGTRTQRQDSACVLAAHRHNMTDLWFVPLLRHQSVVHGFFVSNLQGCSLAALLSGYGSHPGWWVPQSRCVLLLQVYVCVVDIRIARACVCWCVSRRACNTSAVVSSTSRALLAAQ